MINHAHTGTVPQPPARPGARQSRKKLPTARRALRLAALAATPPLLLACAAAASAAPGAPRPPAATRGEPAQAATHDSGHAWYEVRPPATSVSARFTTPKLTCPAGRNLGIQTGVTLSNLLGAHLTEATVEILCREGNPVYLARVIVNNRVDSLPATVKAGDTMAVRATETAATSRASIADLSQGTSVATQANTGGGHLAAFVGNDAVTNAHDFELGVPPFRTITFRAATVDGNALGARDPIAVSRVIFGKLRIRTGPLNGAGTSFTTTFKHT